MHAYRCLQLITTEINSITSDYALLICSNAMICLAVLSNIILIKYHTKLPFETLVLFLVGSVFGNMYTLLSYLSLGEVNEISKKLILSTTRNTRMRSREDVIFKKFLKSCKMFLGIHLNSFGVYRKPTSIRIIGKIVLYTVKCLILMSKRAE